MKHPQINISDLIYHIIGQIEIKMDIVYMEKVHSLSEIRHYCICLLKGEKEEKQLIQKIA